MPISLTRLSLFLVSLALLFAPRALAQKGGSTGGGGAHSSIPRSMPPSYNPTNQEKEFDFYDVKNAEAQRIKANNEMPACFRWPMSPVLSATINAKAAELPGGAREEFDNACVAVHKNDLKEAEKRLNKAVKMAPKFAAAWTLLGQAQFDQRQTAPAQEACAQARAADPNYLPGYLCLADIAAHQQNWSQVVDITSQAIALHPVRAPGVFYYNCLANFYLSQWGPAETSGLRALDDAGKGKLPQLHWLLAKVYEQKGDRQAEAEQIREFLKAAPNDPDAGTARNVLSEIESQSKGVSGNQKPPEEKK